MPKGIPRPRTPLTLTPEKWRPSKERQAQMDDYLWDQKVMRVFCDCSLSHAFKFYGIAASFVFDGSVTLRTRKVYESSPQLHSTFGELRSILFAIEQSGSVMCEAMNQPDSVIVFSDVSAIDHLLANGEDVAFGECVCLIKAAKTSFAMNFDIRYLPPDEQRHNPFYSSAHNAARKEASVGR
jgi:hypothetical protein